MNGRREKVFFKKKCVLPPSLVFFQIFSRAFRLQEGVMISASYYKDLDCKELVQLLDVVGLPKSGVKADLVSRLAQHPVASRYHIFFVYAGLTVIVSLLLPPMTKRPALVTRWALTITLVSPPMSPSGIRMPVGLVL